MAYTIYKNSKGTRLPSVTGITGKNLGWSKDALMGWAVKKAKQGLDHTRARDEAAQVGDAVHAIVKMFLNNSAQIYNYDADTVQRIMKTAILSLIHGVVDWNHKKVLNACWAWAAWYCVHPGTIVAVEQPLVSETFGFGGTPDLVCRDPNGLLILLDWKTGNYPYAEWAIQLAAYAIAWEEVYGERIDHLIDVRLDTETATWEDHLLEDDARSAAEHVFCSLLEVEYMRETVQSGMTKIDSGRPMMAA